MEVLDLFSAAAGGWSLGMHRAGFTTIAACESVDWRRALYAQNNPGVRIYDDVCTLTAANLMGDLGRLPGIVVGSPPCQDISSANTKGKGVAGARSGLFFEAIRIIGEVRPRWFALENSPEVRTRGFDRLAERMEEIGYSSWPLVVGASDIRANHRRRRCWWIGCDIEQLANAAEVGSPWLSRANARDGEAEGLPAPGPGRCDDSYAAQIGCLAGSRSDQGKSAGHYGSCAEHSSGDGPAGAHEHAAGFGCESGWSRRHGAHGDSTASNPPSHDGNSNRERGTARISASCGEGREEYETGRAEQLGSRNRAAAVGVHGDGPDADRERQSDSTGDDREMGGSSGTGGAAPEPWAEWNGGLAGHLRMDDGISAWVAGTRVAVGGPRGTAAASLLVEAFGDAVIPQIPEAIGRAILRTEAALAAIYGRAAA